MSGIETHCDREWDAPETVMEMYLSWVLIIAGMGLQHQGGVEVLISSNYSWASAWGMLAVIPWAVSAANTKHACDS